jgi:hypothetical protein
LRAVIRRFVSVVSAELLPPAAATRIFAATITGFDSDLALAGAAVATQTLTAFENSSPAELPYTASP